MTVDESGAAAEDSAAVNPDATEPETESTVAEATEGAVAGEPDDLADTDAPDGISADTAEPDAELVDSAEFVDSEASADEQLDEALEVLLRLQAERDEYLDLAQRERADHDNARRRWERERAQTVERAEANLVRELLQVLDACDGAVAHGASDVTPIQTQLVNVLTTAGLSRVDDVDIAFDPNFHEAVLTEEGDGEPNTVVEVLRAGYLWRGNLLRPAMVKVRG